MLVRVVLMVMVVLILSVLIIVRCSDHEISCAICVFAVVRAWHCENQCTAVTLRDFVAHYAKIILTKQPT